MVKLYKRTIIASIGAALFFFVVSVVCEFLKFEHFGFAQNYCIGITCSLVVVVITSWLQYKHEHDRLFAEYCAAVREMVSVLGQAFCGYDDSQISDKFCEMMCETIGAAFDAYEKCDKELIWFFKGKAKLQEAVLLNYRDIHIYFSEHYYKSKRAAFTGLRFHESYIPLVDSALALVQNKRDRHSIKDSKRFALECLEEWKEANRQEQNKLDTISDN